MYCHYFWVHIRKRETDAPPGRPPTLSDGVAHVPPPRPFRAPSNLNRQVFKLDKDMPWLFLNFCFFCLANAIALRLHQIRSRAKPSPDDADAPHEGEAAL